MNTGSKGLPRIRIPQRFLSTMSKRLSRLIDRYENRDPVRNPQLLERLSSYATIIAGKPVTCRWGDAHQTNLDDTVELNPLDPKDGSAAERKIVIDSALEHEVRGHWTYTPRKSYEVASNLANGYQHEGFNIEGIKNHSEAIKPMFNILEDGRIETRLRWEMPESYKVIAFGDLIRPRWKSPETFLPAPKAYRLYLQGYRPTENSLCALCKKNPSPQKAICESCFTKNYRWEQITGLLLTSAIPPHTPPLSIVEKVVKDVYELCTPFVLDALSGTSIDAIHSSIGIIKILAEHEMIPDNPETPQLEVNEASGHGNARDSEMSERTKKASGLGDSGSQGRESNTKKGDGKSGSETQKTPTDKNNPGNSDDSGSNNNKTGNESLDNNTEAGDKSKNAGSKQIDKGNKDSSSSESKRTDSTKQDEKPNNGQKTINEVIGKSDTKREGQSNKKIEILAEKDLQNFNYVLGLDVKSAITKAQEEINFIENEQKEDSARQLIAYVSGLGAGPGMSVELRRTKQLRDAYKVLETRNRERGRRFAREIRDLMNIMMRPRRYQRIGRLDRKQLVNAVARQKYTVFVRSKASRALDLAVSLNVDISGSMDQFNRPINANELTDKSAQLADAVSICAIGLEQLEAGFEARAFGSYQWLAKGFYENECYGIAGLANEDRGGTDMTPAIEYSRLALLGRIERDRLLVIMTDGYPARPEEAAEEVHLARQSGIHVLGILFDNQGAKRDPTDSAMAQLFGSNGFTVIHSLDQFPREVGRAIKNIIMKRSIPR